MTMASEPARFKQLSVQQVADAISKIPRSELVAAPGIYAQRYQDGRLYYVVRYDLKRHEQGKRRQQSVWLGRVPDDFLEKLQHELDRLYQPSQVRQESVLDRDRMRIIANVMAHARHLAVRASTNTPFRFKGLHILKRNNRTLNHE